MTFINSKMPDAYADGLDWYAKRFRISRSAALRRAVLALVLDSKPPKGIREAIGKVLERKSAGG